MQERQRRSFTEEYKRQAAELVVSSGRSITAVGKELGLRDSVLRRWVEKLRQEPASATRRPITQAAPMPADQAAEIARLREENERLRMERDILKKSIANLCRNPDMSFRFIEDHRNAYPVRLMCAVLEVSAAGYYAWRERPLSARTTSNAALLAAIRQVHQDSGGRYGSPRVHAALQVQGRGASRGRIERLMHRHGIRAIMAPPRRVRTTDSHHGLPIAPNLIERHFAATAANRIWLADITYIPTAEGWLYLAAVMDLFSRKIVGWAMRDHMQVELASSALKMAIQQQQPKAGLIHHSDRGVQYASQDYRAVLSAAGITGSMSRKADCYDNAPMESFFHTLKTELVHHRQYNTRAEAQRDIFAFIEGFYNRTRLHSAIGYIAPIEWS
ncbi:IS3 family transposase [Bradyrhizobium acaciae]|uniref:IS3 family transposase n=1 Tax=Bradyrhizobium acaciae TaxID=2683706 RepID=UPI001E4732D2|nr:IS3 family transposase [Bradyrhizobium acaciae]